MCLSFGQILLSLHPVDHVSFQVKWQSLMAHHDALGATEQNTRQPRIDLAGVSSYFIWFLACTCTGMIVFFIHYVFLTFHPYWLTSGKKTCELLHVENTTATCYFAPNKWCEATGVETKQSGRFKLSQGSLGATFFGQGTLRRMESLCSGFLLVRES